MSDAFAGGFGAVAAAAGAGFREQIDAFLARELTDELRAAADRNITMFVHPHSGLAWQRKLRAAGWLAPHWPRAYGGAEWSREQIFTFERLAGLAGAPLLPPFGLNYLGPALIAYGSERQKAELLPRILAGDDYWCQGYSEPAAGSDLAAVQCAARLDGEHYIVSGTKLWTTHAQHANRIFCLVRTSKEDRPHRGISLLLIDLDDPAVTVRPIITLDGEHEVNQIFFDDARVPRANLVGREGQGWEIALYILERERGGFIMGGRLRRKLYGLRQLLAASVGKDSTAGQRRHDYERALGLLDIDLQAFEYSELRLLEAWAGGRPAGLEASVAKIDIADLVQRMDELAVQVLGPRAIAAAAPVAPHAVRTYLANRAVSIYGGSSEIQRTLVARSLLGA